MSSSRTDRSPARDAVGFDLSRVTWGYQELFRRILAELAGDGSIGPSNVEATETLAQTLATADSPGFDAVLRGLLEALRGEYRWLLRLPRLFGRWSQTGIRLAQHRHCLGLRFFQLAGQGGLGRTAAELTVLLDQVESLQPREPELLGPLLQGYEVLHRRLTPAQLQEYVLEACQLHQQNPAAARAFLTGELHSAGARLEQLARRVDLTRTRPALERLTRGLTGLRLDIHSLDELDPDDRRERGAAFVAGYGAIFLSPSLDEFPSRDHNLDGYKALTAVAAACHLARGFVTVHGRPGFGTARELFRHSAHAGREWLAAAFHLAELARILAFARQRFPGLRAWIRRLVQREFEARPCRTLSDALLAQLIGAEGVPVPELVPELGRELLDALREVAQASRDFEDTASRLLAAAPRLDAARARLPDLSPARPVWFFPDPLFPLEFAVSQVDRKLLDLRSARRLPGRQPATDDERRPQPARGGFEDGSGRDTTARHDSEPGQGAALVGFLYSEWSQTCGDYLRNWCCVQERRPQAQGRAPDLPLALLGYAEQVRAVFERLKPQQMRRETRLFEGDDIRLDHFLDYVSQREAEPNAEMRFYSKPLPRRRDVAVVVLLDLSGSTADLASQRQPGTPLEPGPTARRSFGIPELAVDSRRPRTVLEIEKQAAFVLASGLASLGDAFAVYGFTGAGREHCQFVVFKEFDETWDRSRVRGLLDAAPGTSTRIGPALRHAGWKLNQRPARTRLLLLVTDGKPCDQGYETETHYAHHDVHQACQENLRRRIHTFCVSTHGNTPADMELMFSSHRYLILEDIARLPAKLSRLYLHLTR